MNKTYTDISNFFHEFNRLLKDDQANGYTTDAIGIAPSYMGLLTAANYIKRDRVILAAQNISESSSGAFTSQISCSMLKEFNINTSLIGHSEVRQYLNDTDDKINKKVLLALQEHMTPILCVGETIDEFNANKTLEVITNQLNTDLKDVIQSDAPNILIAYEPIWAIGTGKTATIDIVEKTCTSIRDILTAKFAEHAKEISILYGGSVNEKNAKEILSTKNVDGVLVGGASLEPNKFFDIIKSTPQYLKIDEALKVVK
jgi:triosephosphate isomerase